jgi:hypothetical protein
MLLVAAMLAGCGNVWLSGDAMTVTENSCTDAYNAAQRADKDANIPNWNKVYLDENFYQWRSYVRAAKANATWGPKLPQETGFPVIAPVVVPPAR